MPIDSSIQATVAFFAFLRKEIEQNKLLYIREKLEFCIRSEPKLKVCMHTIMESRSSNRKQVALYLREIRNFIVIWVHAENVHTEIDCGFSRTWKESMLSTIMICVYLFYFAAVIRLKVFGHSCSRMITTVFFHNQWVTFTSFISQYLKEKYLQLHRLIHLHQIKFMCAEVFELR